LICATQNGCVGTMTCRPYTHCRDGRRCGRVQWTSTVVSPCRGCLLLVIRCFARITTIHDRRSTASATLSRPKRRIACRSVTHCSIPFACVSLLSAVALATGQACSNVVTTRTSSSRSSSSLVVRGGLVHPGCCYCRRSTVGWWVVLDRRLVCCPRGSSSTKRRRTGQRTERGCCTRTTRVVCIGRETVVDDVVERKRHQREERRPLLNDTA